MAAVGHKRFRAFGKAVANHIQHRGNNQPISAQVNVSINNIYRNPLFPERTIVLVDGIFILHPEITRPLSIIQRPAVLLVKDNRHLRIRPAAHHARQLA